MVNLDKSGNATLINDKVSLKTITPTKLRTSAYVFDIANELLNFGKEDIDLKKIIGSTNVYDEDKYDLNAEASDSDDETGGGKGNGTGSGTGEGNGSGTEGSATGDGTGGTGAGTNGNGTTNGTNSNYNNNYDSGISDSTVEEIIKATKNTSVIRVASNINSISVDYVVYDPDNEYKSVYVEVENSLNGQVNVVYLSKTDTNILINNLTPNVYYNLTFKYSYVDSGQTKEYTFDNFGIYTEVPTMTLSVVKIVDGNLFYKINLDNKYNIVGGAINLLVNGQIVRSTSISARGNTDEISGGDCFFKISDLKLKKSDEENQTVITLKLVSLSFNTYTINPNISYKFKY